MIKLDIDDEGKVDIQVKGSSTALLTGMAVGLYSFIEILAQEYHTSKEKMKDMFIDGFDKAFDEIKKSKGVLEDEKEVG